MSTGAPLNLPKPKATTNTGQDMIEMGNSLQKINDAHAALMGRVGAVEGVQMATWRSDDRVWHDKPNGFYQVGSDGVSLGYPSVHVGIVHFRVSAGSNCFQIANTNTSLYIRRFNPLQSMDWVQIG